ncbi:hypothetical protein B0T19DRAFT_475903 [Cercophora scortea]|uniref:HNH nuclease domain-containing protein n=1 Tax=Cercophora scortea TaxID=314031 RepID=A0AAE0IN72_9PEZI|nr:hypothetical protein B0T19DRAFT_475903 [Cercophora scortea]
MTTSSVTPSPAVSEIDRRRAQAFEKFCRILKDLEKAVNQQLAVGPFGYGEEYNRPALVFLMFEYARSPESRDRFLEAFFEYLVEAEVLDDNDNDDIDLSDDGVVDSCREAVFSFADELVFNFFLPLRAATTRIPQPTPTYHSPLQQVPAQEEQRQQQPMQESVGTPERLEDLRDSCLTRDRHRCVITGAFDQNEFLDRLRQPPPEMTMDFGAYHPIWPVRGGEEEEEEEEDEEGDDDELTAIAILNMFDVGITHLIEDIDDIDWPGNAITLSLEMRKLFGNFDIYFERIEVDDDFNTAFPGQHIYQISAFHPFVATQHQFPVRRALFSHPGIEAPLERLFELHSAIGHVLYFSGAGEYIDLILEDFEDEVVPEDGSSPPEALLNGALGMSM